MKKTGAQLAVHALEQLPVTHTFGIPGVHVTELYDELNKSKKIRPVLVTHECGAAFMADAVSRTSASIGTLVIVPAAGVTHALSGIAEAFLDGIPMLIISGGVNIYPQQIEDALALHPKISDVAVIGVPHDELGEVAKRNGFTHAACGPFVRSSYHADLQAAGKAVS